MLRLVNLEEIESTLLQVPALVRLQEGRSHFFVEGVRAWLVRLQESLEANRLYQAGRIGALRSALASAEQGLIPTGLSFRGSPTRTRVLGAAAADVLQRGVECVTGIVEENRKRFGEAERVALQILAVARAQGILPAELPGQEHGGYLRVMRQALRGQAELAPALTHLEGMVGPHDTLILLDRGLATIMQQ